jgi:hypothetical protein
MTVMRAASTPKSRTTRSAWPWSTAMKRVATRNASRSIASIAAW